MHKVIIDTECGLMTLEEEGDIVVAMDMDAESAASLFVETICGGTA